MDWIEQLTDPPEHDILLIAKPRGLLWSLSVKWYLKPLTNRETTSLMFSFRLPCSLVATSYRQEGDPIYPMEWPAADYSTGTQPWTR